MGLIDTLERIFIPSKRPKSERINFKEIIGKPKEKNRIKTFRTSAVGCEYSNADGSDRQSALEKLKAGEKVRLLWDAGEDGAKKTIYLVRGPYSQKLNIGNCFGRLDDKVAADVIRWLNRDYVTTTAKVVKIVGGTRKRPKLGCIIELSTYQTAESKKRRSDNP